MKQLKSIKGVTLLEIMLVLAIAAMVIVMSIRYYQSATLSQQVNQTMSQIQAIAAAADNLAIGSGSYVAATQAAITAQVGTANMNSVTGQPIVISNQAASLYHVDIPVNAAICESVTAKLVANKKIVATPCGTHVIYDYDNTQTS